MATREAELKTLASFIAAASGSSELVREAGNIELVKRPEPEPGEQKFDVDKLPTLRDLTSMFGGTR